jgi:hypothetical protein
MSYLLIDPPVSPLSSPSAIEGWIEDLLDMARDPAYANTPAEKQIALALSQARDWHARALQLESCPEQQTGRHTGSRR